MGIVTGILRIAESAEMMDLDAETEECAQATDMALNTATLAGVVTYGATEEFVNAEEAEEE